MNSTEVYFKLKIVDSGSRSKNSGLTLQDHKGYTFPCERVIHESHEDNFSYTTVYLTDYFHKFSAKDGLLYYKGFRVRGVVSFGLTHEHAVVIFEDLEIEE
jgi:hypothetical protein